MSPFRSLLIIALFVAVSLTVSTAPFLDALSERDNRWVTGAPAKGLDCAVDDGAYALTRQ